MSRGVSGLIFNSHFFKMHYTFFGRTKIFITNLNTIDWSRHAKWLNKAIPNKWLGVYFAQAERAECSLNRWHVGFSLDKIYSQLFIHIEKVTFRRVVIQFNWNVFGCMHACVYVYTFASSDFYLWQHRVSRIIWTAIGHFIPFAIYTNMYAMVANGSN